MNAYCLLRSVVRRGKPPPKRKTPARKTAEPPRRTARPKPPTRPKSEAKEEPPNRRTLQPTRNRGRKRPRQPQTRKRGPRPKKRLPPRWPRHAAGAGRAATADRTKRTGTPGNPTAKKLSAPPRKRLSARHKHYKRGCLTSKAKCPKKIGRVKHYPVVERVRYCTGLFPFNRDLILLLSCYQYILQSLCKGFRRFKFSCIKKLGFLNTEEGSGHRIVKANAGITEFMTTFVGCFTPNLK